MAWPESQKQIQEAGKPSLVGVGALLGAASVVHASAKISSLWTVAYVRLTWQGGPQEISSQRNCDLMIPGYFVLLLLYSRALYIDATAVYSHLEKGTCWLWSKLWWLVVVEGVLFVYVSLILGLADEGVPKPFANIRTHGGTNHYLAPTGLIQSEVIRVENTTSSYLNAMYPAEVTALLEPRAQELLKLVGHSGRVFGPIKGRLSSPGRVMRNQPGPNFIRYTMPAFELRRLLTEVRQKNESFSLDYTRLSGYDANQAHKATGPRVRLWEDGFGDRKSVV